MSCVSAIIPGKCSSLSKTTVYRVLYSPFLDLDREAGLRASSSATLAKLAPEAAMRVRKFWGYNHVTRGVVMKVRTRASSTNMEKTRGERMPADNPTLRTISSTRLDEG